jgi:hypothetical protein
MTLTTEPLHTRIVAAPVVHERVLPELTERCSVEPDLAALGSLVAARPVRELLAGARSRAPAQANRRRATN